MTPDKDLTEEVTKFIDFLDRLKTFSLPVEKKEELLCGDENPTIYKNGVVNIAIVFVGDSDVIRGTYYGYEPYVDFIERMSRNGIDTYYLLARGKLNTLIADATAKVLEEKRLLRLTDRYVDRVDIAEKTIDTILLRLQRNEESLSANCVPMR